MGIEVAGGGTTLSNSTIQPACLPAGLINQSTNLMIVTTTHSIEGRMIIEYIGVVTSQTIIGANFFKDILAGLRDFFGGRSGAYEKILDQAKLYAISELVERAKSMGADAVVGIDLDYETVGTHGSMLMVSVSGTAVKLQ